MGKKFQSQEPFKHARAFSDRLKQVFSPRIPQSVVNLIQKLDSAIQSKDSSELDAVIAQITAELDRGGRGFGDDGGILGAHQEQLRKSAALLGIEIPEKEKIAENQSPPTFKADATFTKKWPEKWQELLPSFVRDRIRRSEMDFSEDEFFGTKPNAFLESSQTLFKKASDILLVSLSAATKNKTYLESMGHQVFRDPEFCDPNFFESQMGSNSLVGDPPRTFDVIVSLWNHFSDEREMKPRPNRIELIDKVLRWLRPGGFFICQTLDTATLHENPLLGEPKDKAFDISFLEKHLESSVEWIKKEESIQEIDEGRMIQGPVITHRVLFKKTHS